MPSPAAIVFALVQHPDVEEYLELETGYDTVVAYSVRFKDGEVYRVAVELVREATATSPHHTNTDADEAVERHYDRLDEERDMAQS